MGYDTILSETHPVYLAKKIMPIINYEFNLKCNQMYMHILFQVPV